MKKILVASNFRSSFAEETMMYYASTALEAVKARKTSVAYGNLYDESRDPWERYMEGSKHSEWRARLGDLSNGNVNGMRINR